LIIISFKKKIVSGDLKIEFVNCNDQLAYISQNVYWNLE